MTSILSGVTVALERMRGRYVLVAALVALGAAVVASVLLRRVFPVDAVDRALAGPVFGWCIPLLAYATVARVGGKARLDVAVAVVARWGADRRAALVGLIATTALVVAVLAAALAVTTVLVTVPPGAAGRIADAATSAWIGALAGGVYVTWLSVGSLFGKKGGGRLWALVLDVLLGAGVTWGAAGVPRAHVHSLLGGESVVGLGGGGSTAALYALAAVHLLVTGLRTPR